MYLPGRYSGKVYLTSIRVDSLAADDAMITPKLSPLLSGTLERGRTTERVVEGAAKSVERVNY